MQNVSLDAVQLLSGYPNLIFLPINLVFRSVRKTQYYSIVKQVTLY